MAILDHIYEAVSDDEAYAALPAAMAALVGARSCVILGFDSALTLRSAATSYFSSEMIDFQMSEEARHLDIWTAFGAQRHRIGLVGNTEDFWDPAHFLGTPYFNECIRRFGDDTVRSLGGVIQSADGYLSMAVQSGRGARPFDDGDAALIARHMPHVFRMLDLRARLGAANARGDMLQQALDQSPSGVLAVDGAMRIQAANRRAMAILAAGDGLRSSGGRLSAVDGPLQDRITQAVRSAAGRGERRADAILIARASGLASYRVLVTPVRSAQPMVLVIVDDPEDHDPSLATSLARMFGLTGAEAALAALLADGLTPEQAAETREVRLTTVRSQIKSLLEKTEARRLTDLVRLLARAPRRPPQP